MNVLVLQLKRIGDLVLTTPALTALQASGAKVSLLVEGACASLLPAIAGVAERLVYSRKGRNGQLWRRLSQRGWDVCLDFTGSDRSALMGWFSRTPRRITFDWVRKRVLRRLAYHTFVNSPVRQAHTCDHYLDLLHPLGIERGDGAPSLEVPPAAREQAAAVLAATGIAGSYVLVHPGTARAEKYWPPERWVEVITWLRKIGLSIAITCGPDPFERGHAASIERQLSTAAPEVADGVKIVSPSDLLLLTALVENARLVVSCDTAVVHLAAACQRPQVALYGPTNPFHWRPRHERAVVISAIQPDAPLHQFAPKMGQARMEEIPARTVIHALEDLLVKLRAE
jgi:ADP-heptose:LPS heptosyltransferase